MSVGDMSEKRRKLLGITNTLLPILGKIGQIGKPQCRLVFVNGLHGLPGWRPMIRKARPRNLVQLGPAGSGCADYVRWRQAAAIEWSNMWLSSITGVRLIRDLYRS